jgi:exopolysaccharide biosynthesis protein
MRQIFQKRYLWAITYSAILLMSTTYVLLDTFVIPKPIKAVPKPVRSLPKPVPIAPEPVPVVPKSVPAIPEASHAQPAVTVEKPKIAPVAPKNDPPEIQEAVIPEPSHTTAAPPDESVSVNAPISERPSITATSYRDANIRIEISTKRFANTQVYIADITIQSLEYLKTAFARDIFGRNITQTTSSLAGSNHAILAINGDFCGFRNAGYVIRNSVLYRNIPRRTGDDGALVIYQDGRFEVVGENAIRAEALIEKGAVQAFSFGPSLLENSEIRVNERTEVGRAIVSNPRTAMGIIRPLHYIFVVSDGRTGSSRGLSLYQLASLFKDWGCQAAYNLDGGGSSTMWFNGKVINSPTDGRRFGERKVSDIVYIGYE